MRRKMVMCPDCKGRGHIIVDDRKENIVTKKCDRCKGVGKIPA